MAGAIIIGLALVLSMQAATVCGAAVGDRKMALWDPSDDLRHPDAMKMYIEGNSNLEPYNQDLLDAAEKLDPQPKYPLRRRAMKKGPSIRRIETSNTYVNNPGYDEIRDMSDESNFSVRKIDPQHNLSQFENAARLDTNAQHHDMAPEPLRLAGRVGPRRSARPPKNAATTFDDIIEKLNNWESYYPHENRTPIVPQVRSKFNDYFFGKSF